MAIKALDERQKHNLWVATMLARRGIPVFPSSGKVPLVKEYTRLGKDIPLADIQRITAEYRDTHNGADPVAIGATTDPAVVRKMWTAWPDAVPSISTGPAGLVVLDADVKKNGPELLSAFINENGGFPENAPLVNTGRGGLHLYFRNPLGLTNRSGLLKTLGTDVRGVGGQVVAPSAWREDDRRYGDEKGLRNLLAWWNDDKIPDVPQYVIDSIGRQADDKDKTASKEKPVIDELIDTEWPEYADIFDPVLGQYDLEALKEKDSEFKALFEEPSNDCSKNRFDAARALMREYPHMPVAHLGVFLGGWEGAGTYTDDKPREGEYDFRQIAREWLKNQDVKPITDGSAFGVIEDDDYDIKTKPATALSFRRDDEIAEGYQPTRWLVKHMIPRRSVGVVYGPPGVGKSFLAYDAANHIRRGMTWFGRKTKPVDVLYLYGEGIEGLSSRVKAWRDHHSTEGGAIAVRSGVPNIFSDPKAIKKITATADECSKQSGEPIGLIVLDTLAVAAAGADENSTQDMSLVLDRLRKLAEALDCAVVLVHHTGKEVSKGMRGSSAILGNVDFTIEVAENAKDKLHTITPRKMRDAPKFREPLKFRLRTVVVGVDEDGDDVTSCVVAPMGDALNVVADEDQALPDTTDELAAVTTAQENAAVEKKCEEVGKALRDYGEPHPDGSRRMKITRLRKHTPALQAVYNSRGVSNYAKGVRAELFADGDSMSLANGEIFIAAVRPGSTMVLGFRP
jgi:hypothetical protein